MNNKCGLVSVIIPTFNRSGLLHRAILSIYRQDYKNYEIIVVVDNSSDGTLQLLEKIKSDKIKIIVLNNNVGAAEARNIGIRNSVGEYIAFLDDDDEWVENKLSKQVELINTSRDIKLVSCDYTIVDGKNRVTKTTGKRIVNVNDLFYLNYPGSFSFCLTKRIFLKDYFINPSLKACQDWDLWIKILLNDGECRIINEPLVIYYQNHSEKLSKKYNDVINSMILFYRSNWNRFSDNQKLFNLSILYRIKIELLKLKGTGKIFRYRLWLKSFSFHKRSGFNFGLKSFLFVIRQLIFNKI